MVAKHVHKWRRGKRGARAYQCTAVLRGGGICGRTPAWLTTCTCREARCLKHKPKGAR